MVQPEVNNSFEAPKRCWDELQQDYHLSKRQTEVLCSLLRGMDDHQIADKLSIKVPTVRTHMSGCFTKFQADNRTTLILRVLKFLSRNCSTDKCPFRNGE